jgi:hypothetical protein
MRDGVEVVIEFGPEWLKVEPGLGHLAQVGLQQQGAMI